MIIYCPLRGRTGLLKTGLWLDPGSLSDLSLRTRQGSALEPIDRSRKPLLQLGGSAFQHCSLTGDALSVGHLFAHACPSPNSDGSRDRALRQSRHVAPSEQPRHPLTIVLMLRVWQSGSAHTSRALSADRIDLKD